MKKLLDYHGNVKRGMVLRLPGASGISREWVVDNWNRWIYETCRAEEVYLIENYPVPQPVKAT